MNAVRQGRGLLAPLETRVPPPVLALAAGVAMWLLDRALPLPRVGGDLRTAATALAVVLAAAGFALVGDSMRRFVRSRTTIHPMHPDQASRLVIDGAYRWTRNPMYLGLLLVLLGWAAWLGSSAPLAVVPVWAGLLTRLQIVPEERALLDKFGGDYAAYRDRVGRWFGRAD